MRGPWSTWGLRGTVTASFALGALIVSALLAVGTYLTARHYLTDQRQATALRQSYADASFVLDGLLARDARIPEVLSSVNAPADSELVVRKDDRWYSSALARGSQTIPTDVRDGVVGGAVTFAWSVVDDQPALVVGVPLPAADAEFYEIVSTTELQATLTTLATVLAAFAVLATLAGAALGRVASRRLMAPLDDVATAAARIGAGGLQTRLPRPTTPTWPPSSARSTAWWRPSTSGSSGTPDLPPTSGMSCAPPSPRSWRASKSSRAAATRCRRVPSAPSTSSPSSSTASSRRCRTCWSSAGSTPVSAPRCSPMSMPPS